MPLTGLVELAGEAGSGKTQLVMQLALSSCARVGGSSLIINTEGAFPASRLKQIAEGALLGGGGGGKDLVGRVMIADVADANTLQAYVERLPAMVAQQDIRLVVVDSVAGALRGDLGGGDAPERSQRLFSLAAALLRLNADTGCGCLVTNQVADVVEAAGGGSSSSGTSQSAALAACAAQGLRCVPRLLCAYSGGRWIRPCLGLAWDAACTHRALMVAPREGEQAAAAAAAGGGGGGRGGGGGGRTIYLLSSPALPACALAYRITTEGLRSTGEVLTDVIA